MLEEQLSYGSARGRSRGFRTVFGVDFSGARLAGKTTWVARADAGERRGDVLRLVQVSSLERLAGRAERAPALAYLVRLIRESRDALWAIDAPFGLPVEVLDDGQTWRGLLRFLAAWTRDGYDLGLWALERAKALGGPNHIRRATDHETKAPFDPYHYRIIYQTFHGMRDVLLPLTRVRETAILPFQYRRLTSARRVVVEACPASTLKRLGLPHQNYKQPAGGPLTRKRRRVRRAIIDGLAPLVEIGDAHRRRIMRDPGGDALDAVIAAVGAAHRWHTADHATIAANRRVVREGFLYA